MGLKVIKRTGELIDFDRNRVRNAISNAIKATKDELSAEKLDQLVSDIAEEAEIRFTDFSPNVENIQDLVEKHLVKNGLYEISKEYILYRAKRQEERNQAKKQTIEKSLHGKLVVKKRNGQQEAFDIKKVKDSIGRAAKGYEGDVNIDLISQEVVKNIYDGVKTHEISKALVLAATSFIEKDPAYSFVAARLFLQRIYKEVIGQSISGGDAMGISYRQAFIAGIQKGVDDGIVDPKMLDFDLDKLSYALRPERDNLFQYLGIQTIHERYLLKNHSGERLEVPQGFWMRVAMGLAIDEDNKNDRVLEFYTALSTLRFVSSSPTLFHAGTTRPQLSSCYLTTVSDDLSHIFKSYGDNAQLSKWAGGIGNDWTNIRATGSMVKSSNIESQGVIPFLKIANDVTDAINRSGRRRGATVAYLETWHLDIEDFLDLRRNTGDERRRTHDMNTANWVPDLFMKRVINDETWTLFSPDEVPELHQTYGRTFEKKYIDYEGKAQNGMLRKHKVVSAKKLWRKMLTRLFETGHPWLTFKDPCNIRSPQDHKGVVHSSNLCTEITLNTSETETAVCNLGSVNMARHIVDGKLDEEMIAKTVKTGMRMLDNVIDINYYPTIESKNSNSAHRPVGLGIMGMQDAMFQLNMPFDSQAALEFTDRTMELISYHAILSSSDLAKERGIYQSYPGSKWERGIFPLDTLDMLEQERGMKVECPRTSYFDWNPVRDHVKQHGMRNSNTMAIAPTATIANIAGVYPSFEPIYKNIYVKANISGEFTIVNSYLVNDLKARGLWNQDMLDQLKYYDGNVQLIATMPEELKAKYKEAFEIDPSWALQMTAVRGKWIDQSQSHNVFMEGANGSKLSDVYIKGWKMGVKTTYYLRTMAASQIEKSTLGTKYGFTQKRAYENGEQTDSQPTQQVVQPQSVPTSVEPAPQTTAPIQQESVPGKQETIMQSANLNSMNTKTAMHEQQAVRDVVQAQVVEQTEARQVSPETATVPLLKKKENLPASHVQSFSKIMEPDCEVC
jgi:ribonucleoside-diphosphate reductase alpha chain